MWLGKIHPRKRKYKSDEWRPWFAWYPVKISSNDDDDQWYSSWRWVWLAKIELRYINYGFDLQVKYRLKD